jgi:glutamate 5-kinase
VADAKHIPEVNAITPDIEAMAEGPLSQTSRGGMTSKIVAAKIATQAGAATIIVNGNILHPLHTARTAKKTVFWPRENPAAARKRWIGGGLSATGTLTIDAGAEKALFSGNSLLPAGVTDINGEFERGDVVRIVSLAGRELARGLVAYPAAEARRVMGKRTVEIENILGYRGRDEIVHRDDMALMNVEKNS